MKTRTIALIGQRGSGKSTLFDVLTDIKLPSSGATVEFKETQIDIHGETIQLIDLPGIYSLNPSAPAEKLTIEYLLHHDIDLIINVVNSTLLIRSLELTVELLELGLPIVIALNMQDEAEQHGLKIDSDLLEKIVNTPVLHTNARFGKGVKKLIDRCNEVLKAPKSELIKLPYTHHLELEIEKLEESLGGITYGAKGSKRFYAIKSIENPEIVPAELMSSISSDVITIESELQKLHKMDGFETISYERHHLAMKISEDISELVQRRQRPFNEKIDDLLLHPFFGHIFLFLFFAIYFSIIFVVGDLLTSLLDKPIGSIAGIFEPLKLSSPFLWYSINGAYMGFAGVIGVVLPYFLPLVFLTSLFEDTGYLARIAFLVDGIMHKVGLHGKSIVPFILGFGCSVPALYATRMIESKRDRMITGILIPFIPCTARIAVIFALTAAFAGPLWALAVFVFVMIIIGINGKLLSNLLTKPMGLIMEIPALKLPSLSISFTRTWYKVKDFIREALIFLVGGSILLGWIEYFNAAEILNTAFAPLVDMLLGLPKELGSTLIFGFFRKELIIVMVNQALNVPSLSMLPLTLQQVMVFIIFVTLYFPCFTTLVVLWKEFGAKVAVLASIFSVFVATIAAFFVKLLFHFF